MVYRSPITKHLEIDFLDSFFISASVGRLLVHQLHLELREEAKMAPLKRDLITKSQLKSSPSSLFSTRSRKNLEPIKVYKLLLNKRGGDLDPKSTIYLSQLVVKFQKIILKILAFLRSKELYANASEAFAKRFFIGT